jgi:pyrimidine operon attenuation protein/uracil phosphoribosyltransferase
MPEVEIMTADQLRRALNRIAHEILERNASSSAVALVGVQTRGVFLARRIAEAVSGFERRSLDVGSLDPRLYRDDLDQSARQPLKPTDIKFDINDRPVVLVDDVLYTGRTIRAAMDALNDFGRPASIQLAVVVDRGHRELPIRPDYVGKNVPTSRDERVRVRLKEVDGEDGVVLTRPGDSQPSDAGPGDSRPADAGPGDGDAAGR